MKVLVGCVTSDYHEYALKDFVEAVKKLKHDILFVDNSKDNKYFEKLKKLGFDVVKVDYKETARERIVESRNALREKALENYDYLLSLEQDVIVPEDVVEKLMKHDKEVVSGIYMNHVKLDGENDLLPVVWDKIENEERYFLTEINKGLVKIEGSGLGVMLIKKEVLEKIKFRCDFNYPSFDDVFFSLDCKENGFEMYADTDLICKHLILKRPWKWDDLKK